MSIPLIDTAGGGFSGSSSARSGINAGPSPIDIAIGAPQRAELADAVTRLGGAALVLVLVVVALRAIRG